MFNLTSCVFPIACGVNIVNLDGYSTEAMIGHMHYYV